MTAPQACGFCARNIRTVGVPGAFHAGGVPPPTDVVRGEKKKRLAERGRRVGHRRIDRDDAVERGDQRCSVGVVCHLAHPVDHGEGPRRRGVQPGLNAEPGGSVAQRGEDLAGERPALVTRALRVPRPREADFQARRGGDPVPVAVRVRARVAVCSDRVTSRPRVALRATLHRPEACAQAFCQNPLTHRPGPPYLSRVLRRSTRR
jgi:hypothetical protein